MMNCHEVSKKISSKEELTLMQRLEIKLHLLICKGCTQFKKNLDIINKSISNIVNSEMKFHQVRIKEVEDQVLDHLKRK